MPFKSEAQRRYLFANEPAVAREFAKKTPKGVKLPGRVKSAGVPPVAGGQALVGASGISPFGVATIAGLLSSVAGTALGAGYAKAISPSSMSVDNLRKEQQLAAYEAAIDTLKHRIAAKQAKKG